MKIFISMPMNGKSDEQIKEDFDNYSEQMRKKFGKTIKIIKSIDNSNETDPVRMLAKSIHKMAKADIIYFAPGWNQARGCVVERNVAAMYGFAVLEEQQ